jgi:hypothetical protein
MRLTLDRQASRKPDILVCVMRDPPIPRFGAGFPERIARCAAESQIVASG